MLARIAALVLLLALTSLEFFQPAVRTAQAGFTLVGLVDGGKPSGATLSPDGTLTIVSDDSGAPVRYVVSLAWVREHLPEIAQDDLLSIEVEVLPDGTLIATSISNLSDRQGTVNDGLSTGSREAREQPRQPSTTDRSNEGPPAPTITLTATAAGSATPTLTATATGTSTPASTPTSTATPASTSPPTAVPTIALTPTVTPTDVPPVAVADSVTVIEDTTSNTINVLANDANADGGPISITSVTQPASGIVVITGGGTGLTYQFTGSNCSALTGPDTFTYTLSPGGSTATVSVTVFCVA